MTTPTWPTIPADFTGPCLLEVRPKWRSGRGRYWRANGCDYTDRLDRAGIYAAEEARTIQGDGEKCHTVDARAALRAEADTAEQELAAAGLRFEALKAALDGLGISLA